MNKNFIMYKIVKICKILTKSINGEENYDDDDDDQMSY